MDQLPHLFPRETGTVAGYTYPRKVIVTFEAPPRDRVPHSQSLVTQLQSAEQQAKSQAVAQPAAEKPKGVVLDFQSDPQFKLQLKSLESAGSGIELRNSRVDSSGIMHATVFIPDGKVGLFVRKFEAYADPAKDSPKGKPKNNDLVASISQIRLAALESFWMDAGEFPKEKGQPFWWEVWLREATNPHDVVDVFRQRAQAAGVLVSDRELRFPDRRVVLARATVEQLLDIENRFIRFKRAHIWNDPKSFTSWMFRRLVGFAPVSQGSASPCLTSVRRCFDVSPYLATRGDPNFENT